MWLFDIGSWFQLLCSGGHWSDLCRYNGIYPTLIDNVSLTKKSLIAANPFESIIYFIAAAHLFPTSKICYPLRWPLHTVQSLFNSVWVGWEQLIVNHLRILTSIDSAQPKRTDIQKLRTIMKNQHICCQKHLITIVFSVCFCKKKASKFLHFSFFFCLCFSLLSAS